MTRDEYAKIAEAFLAGLKGPGNINVDVLSARSLAAIACLLMVTQMDRDAAKADEAETTLRTGTTNWQAEDPRR